MPQRETEDDGLEIAFTLVKNYLDTQIQLISGLRTRGVAYTGLSLALLAILGGFGQTNLVQAEAIAFIAVFLAAVLLFFLVLSYTLGTLFEQVLRGPAPRWLVRNLPGQNRVDALISSLDALEDAVEQNERVLRETNRALDMATILLVIQVIFVAGTLAFIRAL